MIVTRLIGGLGNQMFQLAFGKVLSIKNKTKLKLDTHALEENNASTNSFTAREYELSIFVGETLQIANNRDIEVFYNKKPQIIKRLKKYFNKYIRNVRILVDDNSPHQKLLIKSKYIYLNGYWQSEFYFSEYKTEIFELFQFPSLPVEYTRIQFEISQCNSVSIHIRRGDYASSSYINSIHGLLPMSYYKSSINTIQDLYPESHFFIFSDDIEWVKLNFDSNHKQTIVDTSRSNEAHIDMQLMSLCKHNIIANSSYSWWAAWLNQNENKTVIAPKKWFADNKKNDTQTKHIIPRAWIQK
ncbi:alpha-1,2-fucosyltransferase [Carboxylicivirga caseinilyticus]|uniref:alpha-1,2-fucosyltransferase n=1 Tax=Carboxylicivirga caseinilyticus TaxID=3417572 RepID=UPI003D335797|nr:alpha-1,2-fucosyltransferase [Marinilabiliaceae bacterium A049]